MRRVYFGKDLQILQSIEEESVNLIYVKPPPNTKGIRLSTKNLAKREPVKLGTKEYTDLFDGYLAYLEPMLIEAYRVLTPDGTLYFHSDYREVHYCKALLLDKIFGDTSFLNEIIWVYESGKPAVRKWPAHHDNILMYVKDPKDYTFHPIDRIPYMAPGLVGPEKADSGKLPPDTWWSTLGSDLEGILTRIIETSSDPGNTVLSFCADDGIMGEVCWKLNRQFTLISSNLQVMEDIVQRLANIPEIEWIGFDPTSLSQTGAMQ